MTVMQIHSQECAAATRGVRLHSIRPHTFPIANRMPYKCHLNVMIDQVDKRDET